MSETTARGLPAELAPISSAKPQGKLGPGVSGSGAMELYGPGTLRLFYAPQGSVKMLYGDGSAPSVPLSQNAWVEFPDIGTMYLAYTVGKGADFTLTWEVLPAGN